MQVKRSSAGDDIVYALLCIVTLGIAWFTRIIITKAISCAFYNERDEALKQIN